MELRANPRDRLPFLTLLSRRGLIASGLAAIASLFLGGRTRASGESDAIHQALHQIGTTASASYVGAAWLAGRGDGADPNQLLALLRHPDDAFANAVTRGDPDLILFTLPRRIADDFAGGRVTRIDGWILAQTEATLCALVAATSPELGAGAVAG